MEFFPSKAKDTDLSGVDLSTILENPESILYLLKMEAKIENANWEGQPIGELLKSKEKILKLKEKLEKEINGKIKFSDNFRTEIFLKKQGIDNEFIANTFGKIKDAKTISITSGIDTYSKKDGILFTSVDWKSEGGKGTAEFSVDTKTKDIHLDLMRLSGNLQNKVQGL